MYVITALAVFLILSALVIANQLGISAESNCAPPDGAAWMVNSTVVCESRVINVTSISIVDNSSASVTAFDTSSSAAADLSGNSDTIINAIPDLVDDESAYTTDWDGTNNYVYKLIMNESENKVQVFMNQSSLAIKLYFLDLDNDATTGDAATIPGADLVFGYYVDINAHYLSFWNSSLDNWQSLLVDLSATSTSSGTYNVTSLISDTNRDFTLYWNYSNVTGVVAEIVIDINGTWQDIPGYAFTGATTTYTTFKNNNDFILSALGDLTLTGVTLNLSGNILVDSGRSLTINGGSLVEFQNNADGQLSNLTANAGSTLTIDSSSLIGNDTDTWWYAHIYTDSYNVTNNTLNDTQLKMYNGSNGLVYYNQFYNCDDDVGLDTCFYVRCDTITECNGLNISSNGGNTTERISIDGAEGVNVEKQAFMQPTISGCVGCTFNQNNITGIFILANASSKFIENNTFVNNQFMSPIEAIRDTDSSPNDFIYSNTNGKIFWDDYVNYSVDDVVLNYSDSEGTKIIIAENLIDLQDDDHNLSLFNTSATLTFYGLTWGTGTAQLLKNGVRCDDSTDCNISYAGGTLVANVSGFSNYTTTGTVQFGFNGTALDYLGNALNNTNVTVVMRDNTFTIVDTASIAAGNTGWFEINLTLNTTYFYQLSLTHFDSTTNAADYVGQTLPDFPYSEFASLSNVTFYMKEAGMINITLVNSSNEIVNNTRYTCQIKDVSLGYPISATASGTNAFVVYVPRDKNYSLMVYPTGGSAENFVPVSYDWNNFSASTSSTFGLSNYNATTKVLTKQFNVTESYSRVSGYINNSAITDWNEFTIVPFLLEPGNMIFLSGGSLPYNASAWNNNGNDNYSVANGFYNITLPYAAAETVTYMLFATARNGTKFYGSYRNITVNGNFNGFNFTMYGMLGTNSSVNQTDSSAGGGNRITNTSRQVFQLINSTNSSLSNVNAHIETVVDYSDYGAKKFTFMDDLENSNDGSFSLPLLNITGIEEINVYSQSYAPKRQGVTTALGIQANNNITMKAFNPGAIPGESAIAAGSISIDLYRSNSTCDVPGTPPSKCSLTSSSTMSNFNPFSVVVGGGKISFRMSVNNVTVHYVNVDLMASGPPDALFEESDGGLNGSGTTFSGAMRFGSEGPSIYDFILVSLPYAETVGSGLDDSQTVSASIPAFYDENWNVVWNTTTNGTDGGNLVANNSHYSNSQSAWETLMGTNNCGTTVASVSETNPCYIDTTNNRVWLRLPHFSGTGPTVSGTVTSAGSASSSSSSSSSSSGGSTSWGVCGDTLCNDGETCTCDATENNHGGACYSDCGECNNCDELAEEAEARAIEEAEAERVAKESAAEETEGDQLPLAGQAYGESQTRKSYRNLLIILAVLLAVILIVVIIVLSLRMHK